MTATATPMEHRSRVICNTCGRDNPAHLIFCQECGQKLAPRVTSATPPAGLRARSPAGAVGPFDATAASTLEPSPPSEVLEPSPPEAARPAQPRSAPRPAAPEMTFQRRPPRDEAAHTICPLCGSKNQRDMRFCVTCGHLLQPGDVAAAPTATPDISSSGRMRAGQPSHDPASAELGAPVLPIAPVRVVEVGTVAPSTQRLCPRCRGGCESTAQFCRFCGASLSDAREVELAAVTYDPPPPPRSAAAEAPTPRDSPRPSKPMAEPPSRAADAASATRVASSPPPPQAVPLTATAALHSTALARARLVLVARDGGEGPKYGVGEAADIGRTEGHVVIADDRYLSPRHARVAQRAGAYYLRDLGSTNGVFLRIPFAADGTRHGDTAAQRDAPAGKDPAEEGQRTSSLVDSGEQPLEDQDLFLLGQQVLRFEVVKDAEEGFGAASDNGTLLFGTPAAPRYARLTQRTVEGVVRDVFHLRKAETVIGRESGDVVFTDDPFLSRRHAVVRVHGTPGHAASPRRFTLADLGSSNGTFLQIRREIRLRNGDHFRIGQQLFRFDLDAVHADA